LVRFLCAGLALVLLATGCAEPRPLKEGKAVTTQKPGGNCKLDLLGQSAVDAPPTAPQFPALAPQGLVITNTDGLVAVKLACPTDPGKTTVLRAGPPRNSAVRACRNFRIIGTCPAPAQGSADITSLYVAEFGAVLVGKCLVVQASTMVDGFESLPRQFKARVPLPEH
jgi:hypothetical protein